MERERRYSHREDHSSADVSTGIAPGRRSITQSFGPVRVDRSAADERGVEADADQRLAAAGGSTGSSLPGDLRGRLEGSLGVGLGDVRVHTGDASTSAASSIHARAYAVGQDIHFGAHQYAPGTPSGDYLIAHEVAHTVQQRGGAGSVAMDSLDVSAPADAHEIEADAFADAFSRGEHAPVTGSSAGTASRQIMRDLDDDALAAAAAMGVPSSSPDMVLVNWGATAATPPEGSLVAWNPLIEPSAPPMITHREPDWSSSRCTSADPGRSTLDSPLAGAMAAMDRENVWNAYKSDVLALSSSWNTLVPLDNEFELTTAEHADELRRVENFRVGEEPGDLHSEATAQPAGRTGGDNSVTVGDLFHPERVGPLRIASGTELEISAAGERGIDRAAGDVNDEMEQVRSADASLSSAVGVVRARAGDVRACEAGVQAALAHIATRSADRDHTAASGAVDAVNADVASAQRIVGEVLNITQGLAGLVAFGTELPAAAGTPTPSALHTHAEHAGSVAGSSAIESIANRIVDLAYAQRLTEARAALTRATGRLNAALDREDQLQLQTAQARLEAALDELLARRDGVTAALAERRRAYERLATSAAGHSGASRGSHAYDEVRGAVAAIPIVDLVVSRAEAARDAAVVPTYTPLSGQGLGIANRHGLSHSFEFIEHVGFARWLRAQYEDTFGLWSSRRESLRSVMDRLADNG